MFFTKLLQNACLLCLLILAGCFKSDVPFISETEADFPFQTITYEFEEEDDRVTLVKVGNSYAAPNEQGESTLLIKNLGERLYLIQAAVEDKDSSMYLYSIAKLADDRKSAELIKPFAMSEDRKVAKAGKHGFRVCPQEDQMVCLSDLQAYIDYALSHQSEEKKRVLILDLK